MGNVESIKFISVDAHAPAMLCNCCGSLAHYPDAKEAVIFPFVDDKEPCSFVVCSDACEEAFLNFPTLEHYIMKCINEVSAKKDLSLKVSYMLKQTQLNSEILNN